MNEKEIVDSVLKEISFNNTNLYELEKRGLKIKSLSFGLDNIKAIIAESIKQGRKQLADEIMKDFWYLEFNSELKEKLQKELK